MEREKTIENIRNAIKSALNSDDMLGTWHLDLGTYNGNCWAIVISWMDWDNTGTFYLYGKIAYQPINSIMQCDYDIDWLMPCGIDGNIDDTEININSVGDADYLLKEWDRVKTNIEKGEYIYE